MIPKDLLDKLFGEVEVTMHHLTKEEERKLAQAFTSDNPLDVHYVCREIMENGKPDPNKQIDKTSPN